MRDRVAWRGGCGGCGGLLLLPGVHDCPVLLYRRSGAVGTWKDETGGVGGRAGHGAPRGRESRLAPSSRAMAPHVCPVACRAGRVEGGVGGGGGWSGAGGCRRVGRWARWACAEPPRASLAASSWASFCSSSALHRGALARPRPPSESAPAPPREGGSASPELQGSATATETAAASSASDAILVTTTGYAAGHAGFGGCGCCCSWRCCSCATAAAGEEVAGA